MLDHCSFTEAHVNNLATPLCEVKRQTDNLSIFLFLSIVHHHTACISVCESTFTTSNTVKPVFFTCPLFREPGKFVKITGRENLNTVAFQCNRKQKRQNYGVQNNYIDSNAKIKGSTVFALL